MSTHKVEEKKINQGRKRRNMRWKRLRGNHERGFCSYNRFIQSKDLSSKSAEDMACIFGQRSKSAPGTPQEHSEGEESYASTTSCPPQVLHGVQTINSGQSIQEYFKRKMKEMKAAREGRKEGESVQSDKEQMTADDAQENIPGNEVVGEVEAMRRKKKKATKRKRSEADLANDESSSCFGKHVIECSVKKEKKTLDEMKFDEGVESDVQEIRSERRKKKKRTEKNVKGQIGQDNELEVESKERLARKETKAGKKKAKNKKKEEKNIVCSIEEEGSGDISEMKKEKNKQKRSPSDCIEEETYAQPEKAGKNLKRKKKKTLDENVFSNESNTAEFQLKGEKKKKDKGRTSAKKWEQWT